MGRVRNEIIIQHGKRIEVYAGHICERKGGIGPDRFHGTGKTNAFYLVVACIAQPK